MDGDHVLNGSDIMELGQLLDMVASWIRSDPTVLQASLGRFMASTSPHGYTIDDLHADLTRFAAELGAGDESAENL